MRVNIIADIRRAKQKLIRRAKSKGIYEDFGQEEYRQLSNKWGSYSLESLDGNKAIAEQLQAFFDWCTNFDQNKLKQVIKDEERT